MKPTAIFDIECYANYFLVAFLDLEKDLVKTFELHENETLDRVTLIKILKSYRLVGFNSSRYDIPLLFYVLSGQREIKAASDDLILNNLMPWEFEERCNIKIQPLDHIDLINVSPGIAGLKIYGGRVGSKKLQDLPYEPGTNLTSSQMKEVKEYCVNDLNITADLYRYLRPQLELRESMSKRYEVDLRSKSDAQIAEAVFKSEFLKRFGRKLYKPKLGRDYGFRYKPPKYLIGVNQQLDTLINKIFNILFKLNDNGGVAIPKELWDASVKVGSGEYRLGIGGLHSSESCQTLYSDENMILEDRDVTSYYPSIIINNKYYPETIGVDFLNLYREIMKERIDAKKSGDKVRADIMKIVLNGTFGKLGSKWSIFYSPNMLIQVTLTGQLSLLMLIMMLEEAGIRVVSANTDGVVLYYNKKKSSVCNSVVAQWERITGLNTESTLYKSIHSRDVNTYIAVKDSTSVKTKGAYALDGLAKNPHGNIAIKAVINYLSCGIDIEDTIYGTKDISDFIFIRKVEGGATKNGKYLGKAVRWYYAQGDITPIQYAKNGNKVSESDGGKPLMELPEKWPGDVDYKRYIEMANNILTEIGVNK